MMLNSLKICRMHFLGSHRYGGCEHIHIGDNCGMCNTLFNTSSGEIYVGDYTFTGHNVSIITGSHDIDEINKKRQTAIARNNDILIGKGVWLCSNSVVLGPCIIDDNAVVAAGAVVLPGTHIESGEIYAGVPAKKVGNCSFSDNLGKADI